MKSPLYHVVSARSWAEAITPQGMARLALGILMGLLGLAIAFLPLTLAGALVIGLIAVALIVIHPTWALYFLVFTVPLGSLRSVKVGSLTVTATEVIIVALITFWVARMMARGEARIKLPYPALTLLLFLGVMALSATLAPSLGYSLKEVLKWLEMLLIFLFVVNFGLQRRQVLIIVAALMAAGLVEALYGWFQFLLGRGPESFMVGGRFVRAFGTFNQPNPYAGYLNLILPLSLGLILGRLGRGKGMRTLLTLGLASMVIMAGLAMSLSRAAWLALLGAVAVMMVVRSRRALIILSLLLILAILLQLLGAFGALPAPVTARLSILTQYVGIFDVSKVTVTPENWAIVERMANWQAAWSMFQDHPLLGVGIGHYSLLYPSYAPGGWAQIPSLHAHNYYLNLLAETGVLGLGAYLAFMVASFIYVGRGLRRTSQTSDDTWGYPLLLGILGVLVALSLHNLFDDLYVHSMAAQVGLTIGLAGVAAGWGSSREMSFVPAI